MIKILSAALIALSLVGCGKFSTQTDYGTILGSHAQLGFQLCQPFGVAPESIITSYNTLTDKYTVTANCGGVMTISIEVPKKVSTTKEV